MCLAVPMKVVNISSSAAVVEQGGVSLTISIALTPDAACGDFVLVHAGYALSIIDEHEAVRTLETLREIGAANS